MVKYDQLLVGIGGQGVRRKQFEVIEVICESCKCCLKLGCPAMEVHGSKAVINDKCAGCGICTKVCQFGAIKTRGA